MPDETFVEKVIRYVIFDQIMTRTFHHFYCILHPTGVLYNISDVPISYNSSS